MMRTTIATITPGRVKDFVGIVTELDERSTTVAVGAEGRLVPIFHIVVTDKTAFIQLTFWDRSSELAGLRLGQFLNIEHVVAREVRNATYAEYGPHITFPISSST